MSAKVGRIFILAISLVGCAHVPRHTRSARALLVTGATVVVIGGLAAAGCVDDDGGGGCSGGAGSRDLGTGIPLMVIGAGLIAGGVILRNKHRVGAGPISPLLLPSNPPPPPLSGY